MRTIDLSVEIHAPADKVWRALATAEEIARWFSPIVTGGDAVGDELQFSWGYPGSGYSKVISAREDGRHLRWGETGLVTDWYIEPQAGGVTIVRLVHSGWGDSADWDEMYDATAGGWRYFLFNLARYVERYAGEPRTAIIDRQSTQLPREVVFERMRAAIPDGFHLVASEAPHRLWGTLPAQGDALMLLEMECGRESYHCGVYISLYGDAARYAEPLRASVARMLAASGGSGLHSA